MKTRLLLLIVLLCSAISFAQDHGYVNLSSSAITTTTATVQADVLISCSAGAIYYLQYSTSSLFLAGSTTDVQFTGTANTTRVVNLTGLAPGTNYFWRFKGTYNTPCDLTVRGTSVQVFTTVSIPKPIISGVASTPFANSATVNYSLQANNTATTSVVKYGVTSGSLTNQVTGFAATGTAVTSSYASISGLLSNTQYYYQVEATNAGGTTISTEGTFTTTSLPSGISYSLLNSSSVTTTTATVNASVTNSCPAAGTYNFQISAYSNYAVLLGQGQSNVVAPAASSAVKTINLTALTPNTRYYYRFYNNANQSCGNNVVYSDSAIFETLSASTGIMFSNVSSSAINDTSATVSVTLSNVCPSSTYHLQYSTNIYFASAVTTQTFSTGVTNGVKNHTITGLTPNTKYYYRFYSGANQACNIVEEVSLPGDFTTLSAVIPSPQVITEYSFNNTRANIVGTQPFSTDNTTFTADRNNVANNALRISQGSVGTSATIPALPIGNAPRTISFWYRLFSNVNNTGVFFYGGTGATRFGMFIQTAGTPNFWANMTSSNFGSGTFPGYTWYHAVVSYDGTNVRIYMNGVLQDTKAFSASTTLSAINFANATSTLDLDDLKIYNYALSQADITSLYTSNTLSTLDLTSKTLEVSLYPNPVKDILHIESAGEIKSVTVYGILGNQVLTGASKDLNLSNLSKGVYIVKVQDANNSVSTKKIIKE